MYVALGDKPLKTGEATQFVPSLLYSNVVPNGAVIVTDPTGAAQVGCVMTPAMGVIQGTWEYSLG